MADSAVVPVKSAWWSKVNWTQAVGMAATMLALITGNKYSIPDGIQVTIVVVIQGVQSVATWALKTYFTPSVTAASIAK